jgi:hypothetical protein
MSKALAISSRSFFFGGGQIAIAVGELDEVGVEE